MTTPSDADYVREALHTLTPEGLASILDVHGNQATKDAWSSATLWAHVLREELTTREGRRPSVATNMTHFPLYKTLEPCDFAFRPPV